MTNQGSGRRSGPRIGLLGGTFNPIHLGHLRAAEEVLGALRLEKIFFIPSAIPPHKSPDSEDPIASASQRLEWVELAIADQKSFEIDRVELDREGPSFLVETLETIRARESNGPTPVFIVGEDAFAEMGQWRDPERIFELTDLAVMTRPPGQLANLADRIPDVVRNLYRFEDAGRLAIHETAGTTIELVTISALDISSSKVRALKRGGESIRYLVPETVRESIERSGAYARR